MKNLNITFISYDIDSVTKKLKVKKKEINKLFLKATDLNKTEDIKTLIEEGADVNAVDENGKTALYWASLLGYSEIVKILIEAGADLNAVDKYGRTALYFASLWGYSEIVKILKEAGAK